MHNGGWNWDSLTSCLILYPGKIKKTVTTLSYNVPTISKFIKTQEKNNRVTIEYKYVDDDEIEEYRIVGSKEADPSNNKISNESPIAKAIMNGKVGEIKKVASPNGEYEVEIVAIC